MKIELRDYQREAVNQTALSLKSGKRRTLIVAPTASGKSVIIAEIIRRIISKDTTGQKRVLVLCNQGELLTQNEDMLKKLDWSIDSGIYCAGQGRKERDNRVVFASVQSMRADPEACGKFTYGIVDESHKIPMDAHEEKAIKKEYGRIFNILIFPGGVIGTTGTPWRGNNNIWGEGKFFQEVAYEIKMQQLMSEGYLCPYILPDADTKVIDASDFSPSYRTGDFLEKDLEKISMPAEVIASCLNQWDLHARDRKVSIFFACSRDHGKAVLKMLEEDFLDALLEERACYVDGDTPARERAEMLAKIKTGYYKCVVNVGVLTTGFDAPIIDCVVWLRATASKSLFVQMGGRGLRLYPDKENCLMLDMSGNFERFDSLEDPAGLDKEMEANAGPPQDKKCGECGVMNPPGYNYCTSCHEDLPSIGGPIKKCKYCEADNPAAASKCIECKELFVSHTDKVQTAQPTKNAKVINHTVFRNHKTMKGDLVTRLELLVSGFVTHDLYLNPSATHPFIAKKNQAILYKLEDQVPTEVRIRPNQKSPRWPHIDIIGWEEKKKA